MRYLFMKLKTPPKYKNACMDSVNEIIRADFNKIMENREMTNHGIYLYGEPGIGKTYTAYAISEFLNKNHLTTRVVDFMDIINTSKKTFKGRPDNDSPESEDINDAFDFLEDLSTYKGLLIIDDIGSVKLTEAPKDILFGIIDERYQNELKTMYTSNLSPKQLVEQVGERIMSRIIESDVINLTGVDRRAN